MKQLFVLAIALLCTNMADSQGLMDKIKGGGDASSSKEFKSMGDMAKAWSDGSYFKRVEYSGMFQPQGKQEVKFLKDDAGEVSSIDISGKEYKAGSPSNTSFVMSYYNGQMMLYLTDQTIVEYRMSGSNISIKAIWGSKLSMGKGKKEIAAFRDWADKEIESQKSDYAENEKAKREKAEAERKVKYSLEDKEVVSIEIINLKVPEKFGHFRNFDYDMKATLKDGTVITTEGYNQGYMSDYNVSYENVSWDERGLIGGTFVKDDKVIVNVSLKKDENIKATAEVPMQYNEDVSFSYNGMSWSRGAGEGASDYRIEVKQAKDASNGSDVLRIRIFKGSTKMSEFSMGIDQTLYFNCKGGSGGTDDGQGSDGGNGGNLLVIKDPNVKYFNLNYDNAGGRGGRGASSSFNGRDGRDGTFKEEKRALNF